MKKSFFLITMIMVVLLALSACGSQQEAASSSTTHPLDAVEIPDSGYETAFAPLESATLYENGTQQEIALDDPRLIRVLNLLAHSANTQQTSLLQSLVREEKILTYYSSNAMMLEITFTVDPANKHLYKDYPKLLICGDTFLGFIDPKITNYGLDEMHAERYWPYAKLAPDPTLRSAHDMSWGGDYWLDILEYCGF